MNPLTSLLICLPFSVFTLSASELYSEKKLGFLAIFPSTPESIEISNTLGPISTFMAFDETKELIYHITAHKILSFSSLTKVTDDENMEIVKTNFDEYIKENSAKDVKSAWSKISAWPAIEFSCTRVGHFEEGVTSYQRGFRFMQKGTFFSASVHGFDPNKDLQQDALAFFATFSFAGAEILNAAENETARRSHNDSGLK